MIKKCIYCKKEFEAKRSDAKYCSKLCGASHHQFVNAESKREYKKQYYKLRKEHIDAINSERYYANKKELCERECQHCKKQYKPSRIDRKFCSNECGQAFWRLNNKEYINEDQKKRYHSNLNRKISNCMRSRILKALKGNVKSSRTVDLIGCSIEGLKKHLEAQFEPWMNWDNHGNYNKNRLTWHIDHIMPMNLFDLSKEDQLKLACNYKNTRPLLAIKNISRGDKHGY